MILTLLQMLFELPLQVRFTKINEILACSCCGMLQSCLRVKMHSSPPSPIHTPSYFDNSPKFF